MTTIATHPAGIRDSFDEFASAYDAFTAHHRYHEWMPSLEAIARRNGLEGTRLLDVACGTGKSTEPMLGLGYEAQGCDASARMLERARTRLGAGVPLFCCDMRELPPLGEFDLVTCIDEPLNYLFEEADLAAAFASAARCTRPGGIYLFDLNTLQSFRTVFAEEEEYEQVGWRLAWRGRSDASFEPGGVTYAELEAWEPLPDGGWRRHATLNVERHWPREVVERLLDEAGFELRAVVGQLPSGHQDPEADEHHHMKAIYVAARGR